MTPSLAQVSGRSLVAGVVGAPIRHSLSPVLHNGWLAQCAIDGVYTPLGLHPDRFEAFVDGLRGGDVAGLNVTLPFKARALALADVADAAARTAGAANLLLFRPDGTVEARNTDGLGLIGAFRDQAPDVEFANAVVVVLGAGGAAQGALGALLGQGVQRIWLVNRTAERAQGLANLFGPRVRPLSPTDARKAFTSADVVINASAAGLAHGAAAPVWPLECLSPHAAVMDMVYRPLETPLLRQARALRLQTVDGLAMLIAQARPSFEAFFGRPAPLDDAARGWALTHTAES